METALFGNYSKLLRVDLMGRRIDVPENNTLLRGLQFAAPEKISYGRFCWNGTCDNCTVTLRNSEGECEGRACRLDASEGMCVTSVSTEIGRLL